MNMISALLLINLTIGQPQIKDNSIGIVYCDSISTDSSIHLTIVFPINSVINKPKDFPVKGLMDEFYSLNFDGELAIFDEKGKLASIKGKQEFKVKFWCDNDGGIQYRPTLNLSLGTKDFEREFTIDRKLQNIIGFVLANPDFDLFEGNLSDQYPQEEIRLQSDFNQDGNIDGLITVYTDDAENCDGKPENNLVINLVTGNGYYSMRCCGP